MKAAYGTMLGAASISGDHGQRRPSIAFLSLAFFVFTIPWENSVILTGFGSLSRFSGLIAFGLGLLSVVERRGVRVRSLPLYLVVFLGFVLWHAATMLWSIDESASRVYVVTMTQLVAMSWLVWQQCSDDRRRNALLQVYVLGCLVSVVNTFVQFLSGNVIDGSSQARFAATGFNANYLASTLALGIPVSWHLFSQAKTGFAMWLNVLAIPACLLGIMLTGSRGGAICAAVGLMIVPLTHSRLRPLARGVFVMAGLLVAGAAYSLAPVFEERMDSGLRRFTEIASQVSTGDLTGRGPIWLAGLDAARMRPVVGYGSGSYATAVEPFLGRSLTAHNAFVNVLVESGGIGLVLFVVTLMLIILPHFTSGSRDRAFYLVLLSVVLVCLMPSTLESGKQVWFVLSIAASRRAFVLSNGRYEGAASFRRQVAVPQVSGLTSSALTPEKAKLHRTRG